MLEMVPPKHRALFSMITSVVDTATMFWVPFLLEYAKNWWILYWMDLSLCFLISLPNIFFILESPKFYISISQFKRARLIYAKIAQINNRPMFTEKLVG